MGQEPVIAHANAPASGYPPDNEADRKVGPGKIEQCPHRHYMKQRYKKDRVPVEAVGGFKFDYVLQNDGLLGGYDVPQKKRPHSG
jgi:hypothetical protein